MTLFSFQAKARAVLFHCYFDSRIPNQVQCDPTRITQIINNLLNNAFKFTEKGYISLIIRLTESPQPDLVIEISDSGSGIEKEKLDRLFDAFVQADSSVPRIHGGTGLGLAICDGLVRLMGGVITLESEPGKGSTFTVRLPLQISLDSEPAPNTLLTKN